MKGLWAEVWQSKRRATLAGLLLSAIIASILYGFNWHTFYDTRKNFAGERANIITADIATLVKATGADPGDDSEFRRILKEYLDGRRQKITVTRLTDDKTEQLWQETNDTAIDTSRTLMEVTTFIDDGDSAGNAPISIEVQVGIRPRYMVSLARAWSFSILDFIKDPDSWWSNALYNRSIPLYGYLITIMLVGFGTIRAIYTDQQELLRLEKEGEDLGEELDRMRDEHLNEIRQYQRQMENVSRQRQEALNHRDRLSKEIEGIEKEYHELTQVADAVGIEDRLAETSQRKSQVERVLASYNVKVAHYQREMEQSRSELEAAEQLLNEVELRREGLNHKLQDRNREIRKLRNLIHETEKEMRSARSDQLRLGQTHLHELRGWEESQDSIEEQLGQWVRDSGHARVNFSSHGMAGLVEQQFEKIDQAFIDRYFTHVNNEEYTRGTRRLIRVHSEPRRKGQAVAGKLLVALDDDAGRTLGLRYEIMSDSPAPTHIGFLLALLLRAKCRDFRHYSIRIR